MKQWQSRSALDVVTADVVCVASCAWYVLHDRTSRHRSQQRWRWSIPGPQHFSCQPHLRTAICTAAAVPTICRVRGLSTSNVRQITAATSSALTPRDSACAAPACTCRFAGCRVAERVQGCCEERLQLMAGQRRQSEACEALLKVQDIT